MAIATLPVVKCKNYPGDLLFDIFQLNYSTETVDYYFFKSHNIIPTYLWGQLGKGIYPKSFMNWLGQAWHSTEGDLAKNLVICPGCWR